MSQCCDCIPECHSSVAFFAGVHARAPHLWQHTCALLSICHGTKALKITFPYPQHSPRRAWARYLWHCFPPLPRCRAGKMLYTQFRGELWQPVNSSVKPGCKSLSLGCRALWKGNSAMHMPQGVFKHACWVSTARGGWGTAQCRTTGWKHWQKACVMSWGLMGINFLRIFSSCHRKNMSGGAWECWEEWLGGTGSKVYLYNFMLRSKAWVFTTESSNF